MKHIYAETGRIDIQDEDVVLTEEGIYYMEAIKKSLEENASR